jgi:hypothetical protein
MVMVVGGSSGWCGVRRNQMGYQMDYRMDYQMEYQMEYQIETEWVTKWETEWDIELCDVDFMSTVDD